MHMAIAWQRGGEVRGTGSAYRMTEAPGTGMIRCIFPRKKTIISKHFSPPIPSPSGM